MRNPVLGSVGIIGGADGPTAIFVTGDPVFGVVAAAVILVAVSAVLICLRRRKK